MNISLHVELSLLDFKICEFKNYLFLIFTSLTPNTLPLRLVTEWIIA